MVSIQFLNYMFKLSVKWPFVVMFKYLLLEIGGAGEEWDDISCIPVSCFVCMLYTACVVYGGPSVHYWHQYILTA
jgi:hypothetical protein